MRTKMKQAANGRDAVAVRRKQAFTLVEIMVVISVIAILMAASFRLMRSAAHAKKVAETQARMEKIQNALSGYYAAYGSYPPVAFYTSLDPNQASAYDSDSTGGSSLGWEAQAEWSARAQPVAFEYPTPSHMDRAIPNLFFPTDVVALNDVVDSIQPGEGQGWGGDIKVFKFGLVSFLLPRLEVAYFSRNASFNPKLFENQQWREANPGTPQGLSSQSHGEANFARLMQAQRQAENEVVAGWLPHLEHTVNGAGSDILGINVWAGGTPGGLQARHMNGKTLNRLVAVNVATLTDAWDNQFYYHSLPPYQSYIIWSAGPNRQTYPPWVSRDDPHFRANKDDILRRIKDDIVGSSM